MRVLVVDDHALFREVLVSALKAEPDVEIVGEAGDGIAAVEQTRTLRPDVVLMDASLPVLNGVDATRVIHAEHPATCIIGLSMHPHLHMAMRAAGATECLSKDGPVKQLAAAMRVCFALVQQQGPAAAA